MKSEVKGLLRDARLTDEEKRSFSQRGRYPPFSWAWTTDDMIRVVANAVAEAQLAKVLGAMLVWLGTWDECRTPSDDCVCVRLRAEMEAAGIKQPEVTYDKA